MNFKIVEKEKQPDGTLRILLDIVSSDLNYFVHILESFEGWSNYTTIKKDNVYFLQLDISPDFIDETFDLMNFLKDWNYEKNN